MNILKYNDKINSSFNSQETLTLVQIIDLLGLSGNVFPFKCYVIISKPFRKEFESNILNP